MKRYVIYLILGLVILSLTSPVSAQGEIGLNFVVRSGFDGYVKSNTWSPVHIIASNAGSDIAGEIRLQTNYPGETYARALSLPSQSQKEVTIFVPLLSNTFTLEFISDGQTLHRSQYTPRMIPPESFLVGIVSSSPSLLNFLAGLQTSNGSPLSVAHLAPEEISEKTQGLSALDVLIFNDIDTSVLTTAQQDNLTEWVLLGGHLIIGGGPNGAVTAGGVRHLLPMAELRPTTLTTLPALEDFVNELIPDQGPYLAAVPQGMAGRIGITQNDDVLLVTHNLGQGKVTYFALDFGLAPMNGWAGNTIFWETILAPIKSRTPFYASFEGMQSINNALANISVATLPAPRTLFLFLCSYILVLVPINYLVLARLRRRELAWLTIPVLIILFSLVGYIGGFRARGGRALLRQISVVQQTDFNVADQLKARATVDTFIGIYSPNRGRYTLKFGDSFLVQPTDNGSGYNNVKEISSAPTTIYYGNQTELQNLWADVGTMATAVAHGQTEAQPIKLNLTVTQTGGQWRVSGMIDNGSGQVLEEAILLMDDYGVKLSHLERGQTPVNHTLRRLDVSNSYSDVTIWGDFYHQLNDEESIVNDQIIRSIFWPTSRFGPATAQTPAANRPPESITLLGWQANTPAIMAIDVLDQRVDQEIVNLLIVRKAL